MTSFIFVFLIPVTLLLLVVGIELQGLLWCKQWCWLGHFALVGGVSLDFGGFGGIEADVASLETVADVDGGEFAVLGDGDSSGPPERLEDVHCIGGGAVLGRKLVVGLGVTDYLGHPGRLHARKDWSIFIDSSVSIHLRVLFAHECQVCFLILLIQSGFFQMSRPPHLQYLLMPVSPNLQTLQLLGGWSPELLRELLSQGLLVPLVEALGGKDGAMGDSADLGTQEVSLFAGKGRVAVYDSV